MEDLRERVEQLEAEVERLRGVVHRMLAVEDEILREVSELSTITRQTCLKLEQKLCEFDSRLGDPLKKWVQ